MTEQNYYRISIKGIVIDDDDKILLSLEDNGKWEMLGGGLDHDEDPLDCLRREINEETGLEVTWVSDQPKYFITSMRSTGDSYIANVIYEIKLNNYNFTPSDECQELRFFSAEELHQVELFPNVQKLLEVLESNKG